MKLYSIETGLFKLDGGAMFGVVPKSMWAKLNPPDENNMCTWASRCLLIETGDRLVLIDTGLGDKQDEKFRSHFYPHGEDTLEKSLAKVGFSPSDITDVILTHLHFDHCGGAVKKDINGQLVLTFPHATYWSSYEHWEWAIDSNPREKASFLQENILPIYESGQLKFTEQDDIGINNIEIEYLHGHTVAMQIVHIYRDDQTISFVSDLIPSHHHVRMPYVMAYDIQPLETLKEKSRILETAYENDHILFFQHDPLIECCTLDRNEKGIFVAQTFKLSEI
ncbi:MAG: MBL fold metallo-hydrolase [Chitinophagales bacterium]|nr:MBL fold metallo-hydrolase [Chitinophagales bacterium]